MKIIKECIPQDKSPTSNEISLYKHSKINTMKQATLLITLIFFFSFYSIAQLDKKNWLVGGSGTFSSTNDNLSTSTGEYVWKRNAIQISPNIGVFVIDKFAVGLKSSFSWTKNKGLTSGTGLGTDITTRFDYGPFVRYYLLEKEKAFNILTDLSYQFGSLKQNDDKGNRSIFSVMAGPVLYFNSSVGIEFLMCYKIEKEERTTSSSTPQSFYTQTKKGVQISIGLQFYLEKL